MNRTNGFTDRMHMYIGGMLFFGFLAGGLTFLWSYYLIIAGISEVLALWCFASLLNVIAKDRIEASKHFFPEGFRFKKRMFVENKEVWLAAALLTYCVLFGEMSVMFLEALISWNILAFAFFGISGFLFVYIPVIHVEMGKTIHRNDLNGVSYVRRQRKVYEALELLKKVNND